MSNTQLNHTKFIYNNIKNIMREMKINNKNRTKLTNLYAQAKIEENKIHTIIFGIEDDIHIPNILIKIKYAHNIIKMMIDDIDKLYYSTIYVNNV